MRDGRLRDEEAPLGRRAEGGVPVVLGHLLDRPRLEPLGCGVDEEVEAAELVAARSTSACLVGPRDVAVCAPRREDGEALGLEPAAIARPTRPVPPVTSAPPFRHMGKDKISSDPPEGAAKGDPWQHWSSNHEEIAARELQPELLEMDGISRASVEAHYKLYQGYMAKRNEILAKLAEVDLSAANQVYSDVRALKIDLTFAIGGVKNHEIYFEHLGGGGGDPDGGIASLIERDFGSVEAWRDDLKATGMGGRGWAWTAYDWDEQRLFNYIGDAQNTFPVWNATPLVALDVYEHAYFLDYQTDRASYIDAFFANLDWDVINELGVEVPDPDLTDATAHRGGYRPRLDAVGGTGCRGCSRAWTSARSGAGTPARPTSGGRSASSSGSPSPVLDIAKGAAAALLGRWLGNDLIAVLAGCAAMAGHWRPLFMGLPARREDRRDDRRGRPRGRAARGALGRRGLDRGLPRDPLRVARLDDRGGDPAALRAPLRRVLAGLRLHDRRRGRDRRSAPREHRAARARPGVEVRRRSAGPKPPRAASP